MSETEIIVKMDKHLKLKGGTYVRDLVRCEDCKRWFTGSGIDNDKYGAECVVMKRRMMPTNFCSYGERKE